MARVIIRQQQLENAVLEAARPELKRRAEEAKDVLVNILQHETKGTGDLARSLTVNIIRHRGTLVARVRSTADHALMFFRGSDGPYAGTPPWPESARRFRVYANNRGINPRHLARIIQMTGTRSRMDIVDRAMRAFRR